MVPRSSVTFLLNTSNRALDQNGMVILRQHSPDNRPEKHGATLGKSRT